MPVRRSRPFPKILIHGRHVALGFFVIALLMYIGMILIPPSPKSVYTAPTTVPHKAIKAPSANK